MKRVHRSTGTVDVSLLQVLLLHPPAACADRQPSPQIDLDVKKGVKPDQVRAINVVTRVEKVKVVDKKAEKKLKEMQAKLKKAKSAAKSAGSDAEKRSAELEAAKAQAALDKEESKKAIAAAEAKAKKAGKGGAKGDGRWVMAKEDKPARLGAR